MSLSFSYKILILCHSIIRIHRGYSNILLNMSFISQVKWTIFIFHEWRSQE